MKKGIIFDLDGVILSTDEYHYLAWKVIADKENIYFDRTINNRLRGVSRMASLDIILERATKQYLNEEKQKLAEEKNNIYRSYLEKLTKKEVTNEIRKTLVLLKEKGYKIAIGSSSKNTRLILSKVELLDIFDAISDGNNIKNSKPDPEVFIKASEMLNLLPSECYVVEDAYSGIDAANKGGFTSIAISDAYNYEKANIKINSLSELLNLL